LTGDAAEGLRFLFRELRKTNEQLVTNQPNESPVVDTASQTVQIELFGMPRVVAGQSVVAIQATTVGMVLEKLIEQFPALEAQILNADKTRLNAGYTFVVDGTFTSDPSCFVSPESEVLLVSRASGG
jgi:molybdopterin converting factor small subunit